MRSITSRAAELLQEEAAVEGAAERKVKKLAWPFWAVAKAKAPGMEERNKVLPLWSGRSLSEMQQIRVHVERS